MAFKYISKVAQPLPPCLHNQGLQVHHQTLWMMASKCISQSLDLGLQIHLQLNLIIASKLGQSWPPTASPHSLDHSLHVPIIIVQNCIYTHSMVASNCISGFTSSRPPCASPNPLDHGLHVHLFVHMTAASKYFSESTQSSSSGTPQIALKYNLLLVQIYHV